MDAPANNKIIVIDDDPAVHKMLATVLAPRGYTLISVVDPHQAWDVLLSENPDLAILDIMMPGMSGVDLCRRIRADEKLKSLLVVMLSAKDSQSDRLTGLQYGADDYVTKPFHIKTLANKIEHMIKKKNSISA